MKSISETDRETWPSVACVGAGHWGKNLVRNFHELGVLARIFDADERIRESLAEQYPDTRVMGSVEDILVDPEVDALCIATPAETHGELIRRALDAGKDVMVEKPLCLSVEEGEHLVNRAEDEGRVLMVGHLLWYHPAVLKLKELVTSGELGRLRYLSSNRLNLGKIRRVENILWSFAPHDISVMLGLVEEEPSSIRAQGANYLHEQIADVTTSFFSFPSGVKGHVFVSWLHPFKEQKLVVVGESKMAVFDDLEPTNKLVVYPHTIEWKNNMPVAARADGVPVPFEMDEPLRLECQHFLECVRTRETPRTDGREALRVLRVLSECQRLLDSVSEDGADRVSPDPSGHERTGLLPDAKPGTNEPYFVHPSSYVDEDVEIGEGTTIWHFSHVLSGSSIGENCRIGQNVVIGPSVSIGDGTKIQNNVSVYEGVTLEDHVFCGPSMVFTNVYNPRSEIRRMDELQETLVRRGTSLGANCTIICGITIGAYAFVAAGAVVTKDVPSYALLVGNPGRIAGWMCECGNRIHFDEAGRTGMCNGCEREYEKDGNKVSPR